MTSCRYDLPDRREPMVTGQPEPGGWQAGFSPVSGDPPPVLISAVRRPREEACTLVIDVGGQNVIIVLKEEGGEAGAIWAFIQKFVTGRKAVRM
ncbi:MAG TPA: hypothetical protein VH307_16240 [Streptosporangiaceae bacterium]|jgi:hypothetical protein|nr:hypothetical protein [Streptosporangiaceae bacterium]